mmetsp:Transcript_26548/g.40181  ORF Transcript_26548/g.40181 Transcript_26548/m.40181 type:complete len:261 (-) Transcript_26548:175-957(-)|eukprot:CAMPEP_0178917860 /NCGR_PEP_ID=MMETSP0786-20121207/13495_1 /TAXON_ID=186022 /ORGANISM="Thalassionema frauenfeldii, Strain CCMP 1798" /LENGTH=260 /DNA_ID=CAMNT_0020591485 /DNA_START=147 /DNA_END=929 /DNA_ORIENTATION=-
MKFLLSSLLLATSANAFAPTTQGVKPVSLRMSEIGETPAATESSSIDDLKALATDLNPIVNYFDPLNLVDADFYNMGTDATIGFLRHAEIKHGRVAMAAFVGYCVQSNWHWPWKMTTAGDSFPSIDLSPEQQWDAIPANAKWQILLVIAGLEIWGEAASRVTDDAHYMKGGQPGKYPTFQLFRDQVHFVLDLYDPFGFSKKMTQEKKDKRLAMEINNGRLAMLGIFGFLSADTIEGSVPLLKNIAIPYDGQVMSPFEAGY